ncbi:MAG: glycosyltransferase family 1 protein [Ruminococcaceae bacterium]|nr:glycosyltransferase family 1 protein [Oscillospiraceae bacterium]
MKYTLQIAAKLYIGGAEKVARDIGLYPAPEEYETHYVVFGDAVGEYEQQLLDRGCKVFHVPSPGESYRAYLKTLRELMEEYSYTAVHAHTMFNAGWVMWQAKRMGVPVRVAHSHSALDTQGGWKTKIYENLMRGLILSCATDLVACGEKAGIRLFGERTYRKRAKLILNGIDVCAFRFDDVARKAIRTRYDLADSFVIGHVGHLAGVKNQAYLLELMPGILTKKPNAKLLLLGEGPDRPMLEKKIADLGLEKAVIMTGNVMNVADYLSAMDVFAFPSLYEGMPLSIIEVQANGLPCVLSTGVPRDVYLTDLIRPLALEDPESWIQTICGSERSGDACYQEQLLRSGFDVSSAMGKLYDIYEQKN